MFIWDDNGMFRLLDGHQRFATLVKLKSEGYEIPELPIVKIEARDLNHAKKKLLAVTSSYAKISNDGLKDFMEDMDLSVLEGIELGGFDDFDFLLPNIDMDDDDKEDLQKGFVIEAQFPNETERDTVYQSLLEQGYMVKIK